MNQGCYLCQNDYDNVHTRAFICTLQYACQYAYARYNMHVDIQYARYNMHATCMQHAYAHYNMHVNMHIHIYSIMLHGMSIIMTSGSIIIYAYTQ